MPILQLPPRSLCGLSFAIPDLVRLSVWARDWGFRMTVRFDHGTEVEEYEEVLAFCQGESPWCRWIMWRNAQTVFVQPLVGRPRHYSSVVEAIEALTQTMPGHPRQQTGRVNIKSRGTQLRSQVIGQVSQSTLKTGT